MNTAQTNNVAKTVGGIFVLMAVMFSLVLPASALSQFCVCPDCDVVETTTITKEQSKPVCCANHAEAPPVDSKSIKQGKPPACDCCTETDAPHELLASSRVLPSEDSLTAVQTRIIDSVLLLVEETAEEPMVSALPMPRPSPQRHHQLYCIFRI